MQYCWRHSYLCLRHQYSGFCAYVTSTAAVATRAQRRAVPGRFVSFPAIRNKIDSVRFKQWWINLSFNWVLLEKIWRKFLEGKTGREGQKLGTICLAGFRGGGVVRNMLSMYFVLLQKCEKYTTKMHAVAPAPLKNLGLRLSSCNESLLEVC